MAEPSCRNARGVRRRRAMTAVATTVATICATASVRGDDAPGRVIAAPLSESTILQPNTLTTQCGVLCSSVTGAMACVGTRDMSLATCQLTRQLKGVSCQAQPDTNGASTVLCLWPEPSRWRIQLTSNAELLALARNDVQLDEAGDMAFSIVLNASDVQQIDAFALPSYATQLRLRAADAAEQLSLRISSDTMAQWASLELLSMRNLDLAELTSIPPFPKLRTLELAASRLKQWSKTTTPALSVLDLSANDLTVMPADTLPVSLNVLNVSRNAIVALPADLPSLAGLFRLSLSHNNLAQVADFPKLPALKELYLSTTQLTTVPPGIANLPQLQILDLSHNNLSGAMSTAFPATLNQLNLRDCGLSTLPGDFGIEKTWELVDLSENPFTDGTFSGVNLRANNLILERVQLTSVSPNIKTWPVGNALSLSQNAIGAISGADLPPDIAELRLADCFLKEVPADLTKLRRLSVLDLSNNTLSPVLTGSLPASLTKLFLAGCGLSDVPEDVAAMAATITTLDLSSNKLATVQLKDFAQLRRLNLQGNALASIPPDVFSMPNLTHLDLRGNPMASLSLNAAQLDFLSSQLREFRIDASAFAVSSPCAASVLLRGIYTVCTQPSSSSSAPSSSSSPSPSSSSSFTPASPASKLLNYILAGAVALVMLISLFVARLPPPPKRHRSLPMDDHDPNSYDSLASAKRRQRYGPLDMWEDPELLQWRVDILDLELVMQITRGVWLARCQRETVVVKRLHHHHGQDALAFERFVDEIKTLGRLAHDNIIDFLGVSWTCDADLQLVVEFMANGDLERYLKLTKSDGAEWSARKVRVAMDVAHALLFLHGHAPALCHGDLKSRHVLLDDKFTAKLCDFSRCNLHHQRPHPLQQLSGNNSGSNRSSRSIAPEVLSGRGAAHGSAVDMYAFGVILAELDSHELPFSDITLSNGEPLSDVAMLELLSTGALQPSITPACPSVVAFLISDCLSFDPRRRPTAADAIQRLEVVLESFLGLSVVSEDKLMHSGGDSGDDEKEDEEPAILEDSRVRLTGRSALED